MITDGVVQGGDDNERPKKDKKKSARRKKSKDRRRGKECLTNTMEKVDALRKQLRDCEETGKASVAQAKGKVVLKKKHGAEIVAEIQKCKVIQGTLFISTVVGVTCSRGVVSVRRGSKVPCIPKSFKKRGPPSTPIVFSSNPGGVFQAGEGGAPPCKGSCISLLSIASNV